MKIVVRVLADRGGMLAVVKIVVRVLADRGGMLAVVKIVVRLLAAQSGQNGHDDLHDPRRATKAGHTAHGGHEEA